MKNVTFGIIAAALAVLAGCGQQDDRQVILEIRGEPVYMVELEQFGRLALSKSEIRFDSPEGQKRYKEIAPNLYDTLIDFYIWKFAAEEAEISPDPEAVDQQFAQLKQRLQENGQYEHFLDSLGIDETKLRDTIRENLATNLLREQVFNQIEVEVNESEIKDYYYQNHQQFRHPKRMRASHIYIAANQNESQEKHEKARQRAEQLRKMIGNDPSHTFVSLARRYSEDPYSSSKGGDLGFFDRDDTKNYHPEFLQHVFALNEGELSEVVQTPIGYHIIWATDHEQSLEEANREIKKRIEHEKKVAKFKEWMKEKRREMDINRLFDPVKFESIEKP